MISGTFIIKSPFQMLCAIGAIETYKIEDVYIYIYHSEIDKQIISIIEDKCYQYEILDSSCQKKNFILVFYKSLFAGKRKADYLFVGDFRDRREQFNTLHLIKDVKHCIYLDDGNVSISLFNGGYHESLKFKIHSLLLRFSQIYRHINDVEYFTVYNLKSNKFKTRKNILGITNQKKRKSGCYFIGTNSNVLCNNTNLDKSEYLRSLKEILLSIKKENNNQELKYIAHGRETMMEVQGLCESIGFEYLLLAECVELYILKEENAPKVIYGIGSSALLNLKVMMPEINVFTIQLYGTDPIALKEMKTIENYYVENGIFIYQWN